MKYKYRGTDYVIEAEQFQSLGYHEKDGLIANGLVKDGTCQDAICEVCGERYSEHLYLQYKLEHLTLCRGDYVVHDPTLGSYFILHEETFKDHTEPLQTPKVNSTLHPLKNPDASHYAMWHNGDGEAVEAIDLMEKMFTSAELLTWAKITSLKYRLRIGKKDDIAKEMKKIETYEAYVRYLEAMPHTESTKIDFIAILGDKRG